jgi:hypothetical protein
MATSATFPNGIAAFSEKRNLLDDVDAADINKIQAEIVAIQAVLGALVNEVDEIDAEVDANSENDAANIVRNTTKFKNLADQLTALRAGTHIPVFQSTMGRANISSHATTWAQMKFPKPSIDTHRGYSAWGFYRAPRSGFWIARAQLNFPSSASTGTYSAYVNVGGQPAWAIADKDHTVNKGRGVFLNPFYLGYVKRGSPIVVYVNQNTGGPQILTSAMFSAAMVRDMEPALFNPGFEGPLPG